MLPIILAAIGGYLIVDSQKDETFADGGLIPGGKVGIVGERGPELITGPANITPMDEFTGSGEPLTVNFTLNAIDTQTGIEFLLKNKPQIVGMIQGAYNSQGKRGIYK